MKILKIIFIIFFLLFFSPFLFSQTVLQNCTRYSNLSEFEEFDFYLLQLSNAHSSKYIKLFENECYFSEPKYSYSKIDFHYYIFAVKDNIDVNLTLFENIVKNSKLDSNSVEDGVYLTEIYFNNEFIFRSFFNLSKYEYISKIYIQDNSFYSNDSKIRKINFFVVFWAICLFFVIFIFKFLIYKYFIFKKISFKKWIFKLSLIYIFLYLIVLFLFNTLFFNFFKNTAFNIKITFFLFFLFLIIDFFFIKKIKKKIFLSIIYSFLINLLNLIFFAIFNILFIKLFL
jgi:hypothetical protein